VGRHVADFEGRAFVKYVALLRGINVGKSIRVPMKELKAMLEGIGCRDVITYLNSGNAVFNSQMGAPELRQLLEDALTRACGVRVPTLIKTSAEVISIAESIPRAWSSSAAEQTYVAYLFAEVDTPDIVKDLPVRMEFMSIYYTPGALVWNIKREDYNRSHITKIAGHHSYAHMTTRNVNTARKLAEMCADS